MEFLLQRAKAVFAVIVAGLAPLLIAAVETGTGFDVPVSWELALTALLTGLVVHQVPNKR